MIVSRYAYVSNRGQKKKVYHISLITRLYIPDHEYPPFFFMSTHHSWHGDPAL